MRPSYPLVPGETWLRDLKERTRFQKIGMCLAGKGRRCGCVEGKSFLKAERPADAASSAR